MTRRDTLLNVACTVATGDVALPPVSGVAHNYVETAHAADAAPGSRWAYHCFKDDDVASVQATANAVGREGWEMASSSLAGGHDMSSPIWCFKRKW